MLAIYVKCNLFCSDPCYNSVLSVTQCPKPLISNGNINPSQTTYKVNERVEFTCAATHKLVGETTSTCTKTGDKVEWDKSTPVCKGTHITMTVSRVSVLTKSYNVILSRQMLYHVVLADLGGRALRTPPYGTQFFHFRIHFL